VNARLYLLQRGAALIMAPFVLVHLGLIFYATARGLSAADILSRTRGSLGWGLFYGIFVAAASLHASIGLRGVLREWSRLAPARADAAMWLAGLLLAGLGLRAVFAVVVA
jgi:fumarate reductase subunit C